MAVVQNVWLSGTIELYFEGAKGVCPIYVFNMDIQGFSVGKLLGFGLKTRYMGGTLEKKKISVYSYR